MRTKIFSFVFISLFLIPAFNCPSFATPPQPVIVVLGGNQAPVGATLRLWGEESFSPTGLQIIRYEWSVKQPLGSKSTFSPTSLTANPTFPVTVKGTYTFQLHVWDEQEVKSQLPDTYSINVIVYDNYQTIEPVVGETTQVTLGTAGKDMIVQYAGEGDFSQYSTGAENGDWLEQYGGTGNDNQNALAGSGNDYVFQDGGDGNDGLNANGGLDNDWIVQFGGAGDDTISVNGEEGDDFIVVFGETGNDTISVDGGGGNDIVRIFGGPGDDIITYTISDGQDDALIDGGSGYDTLTINAGDKISTVFDQQGTVIYTSGEGGTVTRVKCIEHITVLGPEGETLFDSDLASSSFTLTVEKAGAGSGTVTSSPLGIDCGSNCSITCECGEEVTLTATSDPGSIFWGWWGGGCGDVVPCAATVDANKTVTAIFSPPDGIAVLTPNGGENWVAGSTQTIRWTYTGNPGTYVTIELLKGGVFNRTIASFVSKGTGGMGSKTWTISSTQTPDNDYTIRITSTINRITGTTTITDVSDSPFTVDPPSITVTSPNGGETRAAGSIQTVRWAYTGNPGTSVKIELLKGGVFNRTIASSASKGTGGAGSKTWTIPSTQIPDSDYTIRITSTSNGTVNDVSDGPFTIDPPSLTVTSPNGGEIWTVGSTQTIRWTYTGNPGTYITIEVLKGGVLNRTIASSVSKGAGGAGSKTWTIPSTQTPGSDYTIRITSKTNGSWTDTSDNYFTISE